MTPVGGPLRVAQGAALGYASGFVWYLGNCYWVYATMHLYGGIAEPAAAGILVLFCLYLGLYHAIFGALIAAFRRANLGRINLGVQGALLLSPFAWVAVELTRARITGFPWDLLGITQVDNPLLTRLAPYVGAYGISFVIASVNALWLMRISLKQRRYTRPALAVACGAVLLLYVVSLRRTVPPIHEGTQATATLVQENLEVGAEAAKAGPPLTMGEKLRTFSELSLFPPADEACDGIPELPGTQCIGPVPAQQSADSFGTRYLQPTDLMVWPEAPNDFFEIDPALRAAISSQEFHAAVSGLARAANAPMIVGDIAFDADPQVKRGYDQYNSADFIAPDGRILGRYDKMHLVPFGEYVPYKKLFFFAGSLLQDVGLFDPGKHRTVFATGGHSYGTFICYESVFADEVPVCPDGRGCAGEYLRRWMVWRHQRGVGAPEYGAHEGHREPSLGAARHQYRGDGGDRSLWPGRNFRAATHPHKPSRGLRL